MDAATQVVEGTARNNVKVQDNRLSSAKRFTVLSVATVATLGVGMALLWAFCVHRLHSDTLAHIPCSF